MHTIDFSYAARYARLHDTKLRQTRAKQAAARHMDYDDHGRIPAPADFRWRPEPSHPNGGFYGAAAWARNFRSLMAVHPLYVDPDDALTGRWVTSLWGLNRQPWKPEFDDPTLHAEQRLYGIVSGIGAPQHFAPDFRIGFELGWGGLLAKIRTLRARPGAEAGAEFYAAEEEIVLGIQDLIRRTAAHARDLAQGEADVQARANLETMAAINERLVDGPPRTFREACQWLAWFNVVSRSYNGDGAGTRLDVLLRPCYENDTAAGRLDEEEAIFLLACLLLNDPHYYQLSGPDAGGRDVTCRLSYLALEAAHRMGIPCNLTVRVHAGMDERFFAASVRHLCTDRKGWPRYAGDAALNAGFMRNGFSAGDARERIAVGCHWMALPGREYTLNDCVKINVAKVFAVALDDLLGAAQATPSTAELWERFERHLERAVHCTARGLDLHLRHQKDNAPELVLSLLCHGPLERGLDASGGGVEFYNLCVDGSGLATAADSFAALEQRIERERELSWTELARVLRDDFAGADGERIRLMLRASERYGQGGGSLGDRWARRVSAALARLVTAGPTPDGHRMLPGWFSWSNTIPMGRELGATPNGRRRGEPISHGANPDPGFRRDGAPTAMARAIAEIQPGYGNTAPVQMELDPGTTRGDRGVQLVASLIRTHFELGGTLFNINVLDRDTILAAHREPERFPDLVVRVTGFSAYFSVLSPEFRQLVVDRILADSAPGPGA
jgi:formate C-acetyltransferase